MVAYNLPNYERQTEILNRTIDSQTKITDVQTKLNAGVVKTLRRKVFNSSGTWTVPAEVTRIFVTGGGGGGGGGFYSNGDFPGMAGGVTSFDTLLSLPGGAGGKGYASNIGMYGGVAGGPGGETGHISDGFIGSTVQALSGSGGSAGPYKGGKGVIPTSPNRLPNLNGGRCSGGAGWAMTQGFASGGGSGDYVERYPLEVIPKQTYVVTIGLGGAGGNNNAGGTGGNGILYLEWEE